MILHIILYGAQVEIPIDPSEQEEIDRKLRDEAVGTGRIHEIKGYRLHALHINGWYFREQTDSGVST